MADSNRKPGLAISKYPKPTLFLHLILLVLLDDRYLGVARTYRFVGTLARAPAQGRPFETDLRRAGEARPGVIRPLRPVE